MKKKYFLALVILGIILVSGCIQERTSSQSYGVTAKLEISKAPALNENAELTFTITTILNASNVSAKFILPEGFEFVNGNLNWNGGLKENQPMQLKATIKAVKTGEWTIIGAVSGANDYLYITVNENSASISKKPFPIPERGKQYAESISYPKEYNIYQDYLQTIGEGLSATPRYFDNGVIEATVLSLSNFDVCPSATGETCNIEPYPNDYATVRIDRIVSYSPYAEQTANRPVEQPSMTPAGDDVSSIPSYSGRDYPKQKIPEITRLYEGQNVSAHFILTARPVKVRYVSVESESSGLESSKQSGNGGSDLTETVSRSVELEKEAFEPIPKENGYFVFTTKIISYPEVSQKTLPGLKTGDKFRANIKYDGSTLVVGEYEIIP